MRRSGLAAAMVLGMALGRAELVHATPLFSVSGRVDAQGLPLAHRRDRQTRGGPRP
jgi:hypothetical protein